MIETYMKLARTGLLPQLDVHSVDPREPVRTGVLPKPWKLVGAGNYAAVVAHPDYPGMVVKVYAEGRPGLREEVEVYRRLGPHPAYSECYGAGERFLVLKRLNGVTIYDCLRRGIRIPEQVIRDIDTALDYSRLRGLNPHDVHGKNVMMIEGRGVVVDVSDFLKKEECVMWSDFKKSYYALYKPLLLRWAVPLPDSLLNALRKGYRLVRRRVS
ncbi:serine/threonine protein kinase [Paenibacillus hodogayensis]|uniref:Serine/threonine protein kinase n=1 Tax=Paenibacillus hodogayensis TaxID=279208 RepID=A0ABV5W4K8_9BACL